MKLFQQLLVAPAALGLLAPVAATAAEVNMTGVNQYSTEEQVTSVSQFSDVRPTDWAYQALSNLVERYGCVAGYPDGTFKGRQAMTRYEAAALLNACLDRVTEVTDELKRLMAKFEKELALLKGRGDGLEAKVKELEANQFSPTNKLEGIATMTVGGAGNTTAGDKVTSNYDVRLIFDTSFTGEDLLRTTLRAGNFGSSVFSPAGNPLAGMEVAFQDDSGPNSVGINRLFYQFPVADGFKVTFGARVRQDDMLAIWPSVYPGDSILDLFTYAGSPSTYNLTLGAGAGVSWTSGGFSLSALYVSKGSLASDSTEGLGEGITTTVQAGYTGENWGAALAYTYADGVNANTFQFAPGGLTGESNNIGLGGYWQPADNGWIPSISAGVGYADFQHSAWNWYTGLQWSDMFLEGNALGFAIGSNGYDNGGAGANTGIGLELWYKFQVTDNISVTPGFFWVENNVSGSDDIVGGVVKTTFKF
ncbi:MAG: iron uptake porin [Cyanobium sp.]